jgi:hypothetical protein
MMPIKKFLFAIVKVTILSYQQDININIRKQLIEFASMEKTESSADQFTNDDSSSDKHLKNS